MQQGIAFLVNRDSQVSIIRIVHMSDLIAFWLAHTENSWSHTARWLGLKEIITLVRPYIILIDNDSELCSWCIIAISRIDPDPITRSSDVQRCSPSLKPFDNHVFLIHKYTSVDLGEEEKQHSYCMVKQQGNRQKNSPKILLAGCEIGGNKS